MVEECQAEALFWLVILFTEHLDEINKQISAERFIARKISWKLKEYWCKVGSPSSTLRKDSKVPTITNTNTFKKVQRDTGQHDVDTMDNLNKDELKFLELYVQGKSVVDIGTIFGIGQTLAYEKFKIIKEKLGDV